MKKYFSFFLSCFFIGASCALHAESPTESMPAAPYSSEEKAPPKKEVGKASQEALKTAKKRDWQNWLFASTSVAAAVVAIILLRDSGHSPHHHHN